MKITEATTQKATQTISIACMVRRTDQEASVVTRRETQKPKQRRILDASESSNARVRGVLQKRVTIVRKKEREKERREGAGLGREQDKAEIGKN